jgi:predicted transcriptional regulator
MARRKQAPPALHELESELMEEIWACGEASVRDLMERLNARAPKPRAYTTYLTVCARLHSKGLARRRRQGKTDIYRPALAREEYMRRRADADADAMVSQYGDLALSNFARRVAELDPKRRRELERP